MRKRDQERFIKKANKLIESLGGIPNGDHRWALNTKYGRLLLHVDEGPVKREAGTVFTRFDEAKRAHGGTDCNPHSGKWNHHYFAPWTVTSALADLEWQLRRVTTYIIQVHEDGGDPEGKEYVIMAQNELDARVIAFCMDGGMASDDRVINQGHLELVKTWTEVVS